MIRTTFLNKELMTLQQEQVESLVFTENDKGNQTYTVNATNATYPCVGSISEATPVLTEGGFSIDKVLTISARKFNISTDSDGNKILTSLYTTFPKAQMVITFDGEPYRILSVKKNLGYIRIIAGGITRGF